MANQAIALQARAPQTDFMGRAIQQNAQMMNMLAQQRAAQRQAAQTTQAMEIARAEEGRKAELHGPAMRKADYEAFSAEQKAAMEFMEFAYEGIEQSRGPEDVLTIAGFLKKNFPSEVFGRIVDQTLADMPSDPAQFRTWKDQTKFETLKNAEQLAEEFTTQNLGTSTRIVATPKYGGGAARVVPGSEAAVDIKPTVVNVEGTGPVIVDPNTGQGFPVSAGAPGGYTPPRGGIVGGPRGAQPAPMGTGGGSADVVYGFGKFAQPSKPISSMTIGEVQNFQKNELIPATRGKIGAGPDKGTGAVGTYQIVYGTLKDYAPKVLGPNWRNTPFTADVQDRIAKAIYEDVKNGNLKDTWAGLPSNRPGAYSNVPWEQVRGQIAAVESAGGAGAGGAAPAAGTPKTFSEIENEKAFKKVIALFGYDPATSEDIVSPLIAASTSGGLEKFGSDVVGFVTGEATPGRVALKQLQTLKDSMTFEKLRGKLGAQISDADVKLVANTMADIANPDEPANARLAAWQKIVLPILLRGAGIEPPKKGTAAGGKKKSLGDVFGGR
jgi:hypothetical protein